jgi:hypothetical protein
MHQVARDHRLFPARGNPDTKMSGCMSRSWFELDFISDLVRGFDQVGESRVNDRPH